MMNFKPTMWKLIRADGSSDLACAMRSDGEPADHYHGRPCLEWLIADEEPGQDLQVRTVTPGPSDECAICAAGVTDLTVTQAVA